MTAGMIILIIAIFIYVEAGIVTGFYMYLITRRKEEKEEDRQLKVFSITAGIFFPVTLAILAAYTLAEKKKQ